MRPYQFRKRALRKNAAIKKANHGPGWLFIDGFLFGLNFLGIVERANHRQCEQTNEKNNMQVFHRSPPVI
ncbi:MAG: hypothetical protein L0Z73_16150 [Gammaproteobacteria bacterium]|nr:hypothetical protein [Gammaproteobacteria bacterium]